MYNLMMKSCCVGRRWKNLMEIAGEAIILCGSPLLDPSLVWNIATIAETGNNEEFDALCLALNTDLEWVKEVCAKMKDVVATIRDLAAMTDDATEISRGVRLHDRQRTHQKLQKSIAGAMRRIEPVSFLSGELRSMGLGITAQDIIGQLRADGLLSSLLRKCNSFLQPLRSGGLFHRSI